MSFLNSNTSQSQQQQATTTSTTSTNVNVQPSGGSGASIGQFQVGDNAQVLFQSTDADIAKTALASNAAIAGYTIDAARAFNADSTALARDLSNNVVDFAKQTNANTTQSASDLANLVATSTSSQYASAQTTKYVILGFVAIAIAGAVIFAGRRA